MQNGQNRHAKTVEALHIVTLTDEDNQYGLVPYLAGRIRGEHGAEKLYADEDGPDGKTPSPRRKREAAETRGGERGRREKSNKTGSYFRFQNGVLAAAGVGAGAVAPPSSLSNCS